MKIWLIEDNESDAMLFERSFKDADITHWCPDYRQEIAAAVPDGEADLIVADMMLNGHKGTDVLAYLHNADRIGNALVVLCSGVEYYKPLHGKDLGGYVDLFVKKPIDTKGRRLILRLEDERS